MGCDFNFRRLRAKNDTEAKREVQALIIDAAYEHGHGGYSGSFAEATGVEIDKTKTPATLEEAEEWLSDYADKWGPAVVVKIADGTYCVGANCSS